MDFLSDKPMILGGTDDFQLQKLGMPSGVCPSYWAAEHPDILHSLFADILQAGATLLCAPTATANLENLSQYGLEGKFETIYTSLIHIAQSAAEPYAVPIGITLSPSGYLLPPEGKADFDTDIYQFYRKQIRLAEKAGAKFILLDQQTSLADMRAAVLACRTTDLPVLAMIKTDEKGETASGGSFLSSLITLQSMGGSAAGLLPAHPNVPALDLLMEAAPHAAIPLAVSLHSESDFPNKAEDVAGWLSTLVQKGIRIFDLRGNCNMKQVSVLAESIAQLPPLSPLEEPDPDCYAVAVEGEVFFLGDDFVYSEPLPCTSHLADDLIDLEDESINTALIEVEDLSEALLLAETAPLTRLPIAVRCTSLPVLDAAVRYFQGRLIIDTDCPLEEEELIPLVGKYGAILY